MFGKTICEITFVRCFDKFAYLHIRFQYTYMCIFVIQVFFRFFIIGLGLSYNFRFDVHNPTIFYARVSLS